MINKKSQFFFLLFIISLLAVWPVINLYFTGVWNSAFVSWSSFTNVAGKVFGLIGLAVFAISLILSARFVWMDKLLSDFTKILKIHRWLGVISFSFILLHPLLLAFSLLPASSQYAWGLFWNWSDPSLVFGYLSILLFMLLVLMTFFWRLKYERLKMLHSLLAVPLMLGGVHALLIGSDIKNSIWLSGYYIVLISTGVIAYLWRLYTISWGIKSKKYIIEEISQPTSQTIKIIFKPQNKALLVEPGQFIFVSFSQLDNIEEHPFSVAGIDKQGRITVVAKVLGDFTQRMMDLKIQGTALIDGPYGSFGQVSERYKHQIWIAGGIGITPFLSLAQNFVSQPMANAKVDLIYSVAKSDDFVDLNRLKKMAEDCPQFRVIPYVSEQQGKLDVKQVKKMLDSFDDGIFCLCGPKGMVSSLVKQLKQAAVPKSRISIEAFELL